MARTLTPEEARKLADRIARGELHTPDSAEAMLHHCAALIKGPLVKIAVAVPGSKARPRCRGKVVALPKLIIPK